MSDQAPLDVSSMPDQVVQIITQPQAFFRGMARTGGYIDPIVFMVVMGVSAALIQIVLSFIGLGEFGMMAAATGGLMAIFILPVFMIIGGFIMAAVGFVIWRFLGSEQNYETAFRCVAYVSAIAPVAAVLSIIPYLGTIIHVAWGMFLIFLASTEVHGIRQQTAKMVFGILGVLLVIMSVMSERTSRHFQQQAEIMQEQLQGSLQDMENKTPEEMGQVLGEFLKGLEKASQNNQDNQ